VLTVESGPDEGQGLHASSTFGNLTVKAPAGEYHVTVKPLPRNGPSYTPPPGGPMISIIEPVCASATISVPHRHQPKVIRLTLHGCPTI
jgi:hypothetical protein